MQVIIISIVLELFGTFIPICITALMIRYVLSGKCLLLRRPYWVYVVSLVASLLVVNYVVMNIFISGINYYKYGIRAGIYSVSGFAVQYVAVSVFYLPVYLLINVLLGAMYKKIVVKYYVLFAFISGNMLFEWLMFWIKSWLHAKYGGYF
jgi:hypothetical protein